MVIDSGRVRIEYVPGDWILELKSLKYYLISWRDVGAAQEDVTALMYADLARYLDNPDRLVVETVYTVRGGINTTCTVELLALWASLSPLHARRHSGFASFASRKP